MLETLRLFLCKPKNEDILTIENLWINETVRQFIGGIVSDEVIKQRITEIQNHWDLHKFGLWIVFEKKAKTIIGLCGLHHSEDGIELSYMFFPEFWGKSFAREAAEASISYGFNELKIEKIIAITQEKNIRSCNLLKKIGMHFVNNFDRFNATQCLFEINSQKLNACYSYIKL